MNILVSTKEKQGQRKNDFSSSTDGEFVRMTNECDGEAVDGKCGCRRSFAGFVSHKATTTVKVIDSPLTREEFIEKLTESLVSSGWAKRDDNSEIVEDAEELLNMAAAFDVGMVVEKRGTKIQERF